MTEERLQKLKELCEGYQREHISSFYMEELIYEVEKLQSIITLVDAMFGQRIAEGCPALYESIKGVKLHDA